MKFELKPSKVIEKYHISEAVDEKIGFYFTCKIIGKKVFFYRWNCDIGKYELVGKGKIKVSLTIPSKEDFEGKLKKLEGKK